MLSQSLVDVNDLDDDDEKPQDFIKRSGLEGLMHGDIKSSSFLENGSGEEFGPFALPNENILNVKEAIIDLYLAIKIRSTEELDLINEDNLREEKTKLL